MAVIVWNWTVVCESEWKKIKDEAEAEEVMEAVEQGFKKVWMGTGWYRKGMY